ncbi:ABC transporter ATP-binding protein [Tepidimicrobium xylanilyticum]|uniref:Putative ABC transport system ATP-binding protein n=1 Tax=Tepidimicrobium xylanilyticum TaxID=1123352 RepID=A0A1H3DD69_9FIRM|nr:ABC transporter ATP-binding protein [Tepidimicrobium xylanilyticum]GMG97387.1 ABC transporter ATP-binding protein [Tepidimicrobium xylanilyticum]SDX64341.1 putative ABC transport system ATP-binding protein [Tepidimicrobium xylanilyticum]
MIELLNISKSFGDKLIFEDVNLTIKKGEFVIITGESGSGKTTLLNIMSLMEQPDKGNIFIEGTKINSLKGKQRFFREKAGFIFQNYALMEEETVFNNIKISLAYKKCKDKGAVIKDSLNKVGLDNYQNKKIYQLSGGEQQRVSLARLLAKDSQYIFADEPTGNLDGDNSRKVYEILKELNKKGKTVILVTHDERIANIEGCKKLVIKNRKIIA